MGVLDVLRELKNNCDEVKLKRARRIINNKNIELISAEQINDQIMIIAAEVASERYMDVYDVTVAINIESGEIEDTYCSCADYYNNEEYYDVYICKHCAATIILAINYLNFLEEKKKQKLNIEENIVKKIEDINKQTSKLNLEVYINYYNRNAFEISFKLGLDKLYVVKNIQDLINAKNNNLIIQFGKNFTYNPLEQDFTERDEEMLDLVTAASSNMNNGYYGSNIKGKNIYISNNSLRSILKLLKYKGVYYNNEFYPIVDGDIPLNINIDDKDDHYNITLTEEVQNLTINKDVFIYDKKIYIPSKAQVNNIKVFYDYFINNKELNFKKEYANNLFNDVLPSLEEMSNEVKLDKKIDNIIKEEAKANYYIDERRNKLFAELKILYGDEEKDKEKIIIRDAKKEKEFKNVLEELHFEKDGDKYIFNGNEEEEYYFLTDGCKKLQEYGEVFYSEKLKNRKVYNSPSISAKVTENEDGYLDFTFNIDDIDKKEYRDILKAFKENKKYIKLKDSSILSLESEELNNVLRVVDKLSDNKHKDNILHLSKNKAIVLDGYLSEGNINFIEGKEILEGISEKLTNIQNENLEVPKDLKTTLREYQVFGYKWFKNISYLGFGGILADEMGLGKTVQTIAFILSEKDKKSLIIAPTSLVYNWKNEFEKFAPSLNVEIVHGNKTERKEVLDNSERYDVILTTYGTLRNDIELYDDKIFDYCIIDEGQNIKNPLSKISNAVKEIKAKSKFVLSGTPIENNLLELWSIFDFIMPNYLYSSAIFKKKYINEDNKEDLLKHISPFILRREKKDVMLELPEKIEKKYYVEMTKEQRKIYSAYAEDIRNKMEDDSIEKDKITIFSYLTKLRQICLDPSIVVENYKEKSSKISEALEIIKENIENNNKILLFSQFTSVLKNISKSLDKEKINYMYLDGSISAKRRLEMVEEFNNSDDCNIFLISLKAGGTGLNLTSANVVIHFDPWWNPAIEDQATDRAHRIGQKNIVNVIKLISKGTIEEKIIKMQEEKKKLIGDVINNKDNSENTLMSISNEELKQLFYM